MIFRKVAVKLINILDTSGDFLDDWLAQMNISVGYIAAWQLLNRQNLLMQSRAILVVLLSSVKNSIKFYSPYPKI